VLFYNWNEYLGVGPGALGGELFMATAAAISFARIVTMGEKCYLPIG
jgi:hypothetical protein